MVGIGWLCRHASRHFRVLLEEEALSCALGPYRYTKLDLQLQRVRTFGARRRTASIIVLHELWTYSNLLLQYAKFAVMHQMRDFLGAESDLLGFVLKQQFKAPGTLTLKPRPLIP